MSLPVARRPQAVLDMMEDEKRTSLKLVVKKKDLFLSCMIKWYKNMSAKQRATLTKKRLIKRGVLEAYRLNLPCESIPFDWMKTVKEECGGLTCYISKNALARRRFRKEVGLAYGLESEVEKSEQQVVKAENNGGGQRRKRFIDLTSEEPPESWTAAKEGMNPLRRHLSIASTEDSNILYWDYDATHWKVDGEINSMTLDPSKSPSRSISYNEWSN